MAGIRPVERHTPPNVNATIYSGDEGNVVRAVVVESGNIISFSVTSERVQQSSEAQRFFPS